MKNTETEPEKAAANDGVSAGLTAETPSEIDELPKAIVRRIVKEKLSQISSESELSVQREALTAFSESARIFIHYLSATANDICKESKRQTINAEDVFKALEEMEYLEFDWILRASLQELRKNNAVKKSGSLKEKESEDQGNQKESPVRNRDDEEAENGVNLEAENHDDSLEAENGNGENNSIDREDATLEA